MKTKALFFAVLCSSLAFSKAPTGDTLNNLISNSAVDHLAETDRVNRKAIKSIRVVNATAIDNHGLYSASVFIAEVACSIIFVYDVRLTEIADGWTARVMGENVYDRKWNKSFLFAYRGLSRVVAVDSGAVPGWIDPGREAIGEIFFALLKQDFGLDSSATSGLRVDCGKICKKYVTLQREEVEVCPGQMIKVKAEAKKGEVRGDYELIPAYEAALFFYRLPGGKWSADLLSEIVKKSVSKKLSI